MKTTKQLIDRSGKLIEAVVILEEIARDLCRKDYDDLTTTEKNICAKLQAVGLIHRNGNALKFVPKA